MDVSSIEFGLIWMLSLSFELPAGDGKIATIGCTVVSDRIWPLNRSRIYHV